MEEIKKLVLATVPTAAIEEKARLCIQVAPQDVHPLMVALKNYRPTPFDYLAQLTGMDWGDTLGVVYLLSSSENLALEVQISTATADRNNPLLYSVTDLFETAHLNEREVFAMFGIRFIGNPDMRRFILSADWKGFPLRKDYDADPILNPVTTKSKEMSDVATYLYETPAGEVKEGSYNIFEKDDYVINIGPQHPSTHGVMHFRTALDGEIVKKNRRTQRLHSSGYRKVEREPHLSADSALYRPLGLPFGKHQPPCFVYVCRKSCRNRSSGKGFVHSYHYGRAYPHRIAFGGLGCNV